MALTKIEQIFTLKEDEKNKDMRNEDIENSFNQLGKRYRDLGYEFSSDAFNPHWTLPNNIAITKITEKNLKPEDVTEIGREIRKEFYSFSYAYCYSPDRKDKTDKGLLFGNVTIGKRKN